jgi:hypothetical protein
MGEKLKHCSRCDKDLPLESFNKDKTRKDGLAWFCRECNKKNSAQYYIDNREKCLDNFKDVYERNKEDRLIQAKEYRDSHKEEIKSYFESENGKANHRKAIKKRLENGKITEYARLKRSIDPNYKLSQSLTNRICNLIKKRKTVKSNHTFILLGCSLEHFKQHLESKFQEGMTFENYGEWHIDHYIPCTYFDLADPENQRICFNYRNLQPLWKKDNLSKKNKVPENVLELINDIKQHLKQAA